MVEKCVSWFNIHVTWTYYSVCTSELCNSCIMYPSDLPDMSTQARGPSGPRTWVYISGKSRGHMIQLICTISMQAKSLQAINHPNQYETDHQIHQLVKFDYGTATTNVVTTFVNINGQILRISRKHSI